MARISFWIFGGTMIGLAACASSKQSAAPARQPAASAPADAALEESPRNRKAVVGPPAASPAAPLAPAAEPPPAGAPARPPSVDVGSAAAGQSMSRDFARSPEAADPHGASGARVRLAEARRELDVATSERDCVRACRALESMERAAQQVCDLARSPDERRECASAGEQVDKARSKVRSACGECPQKVR